MHANPSEVTTHIDSLVDADDKALAGDSDALATEAYRLIEQLGTGDLPDEDLARLSEVTRELDRRGVPYAGRW